MGPAAFLQEVHDIATDGLVELGAAGLGTYTPPGGPTTTDVRVYLRRADQLVGDFSQTVARRDVVRLLLAEIPNPVRLAVVVVDGLTLTLEAEVDRDLAKAYWTVSRA